MLAPLASLRPFQVLGLRALRLLKQSPLTYNQLADKLCICRRYAERVVQCLQANGFVIHSRTECRQKHFWTAAEADFLSTILTEAEKQELSVALTGQNYHLQAAFYKLTQLLKVKH